MRIAVGLFSGMMLAMLSLVSLYQWIMALVSVSARPLLDPDGKKQYPFLILIPAHNEAPSLPTTLESVGQIEYPKDLIQVVVVADRCADATAGVARERGAICLERTSGEGGKGAAIAWAIQEITAANIEYEAMVIIDADVTVHPQMLAALNRGLVQGHAIQQGYNYLSNPWESPFTRVIAVTSVLKNQLFYGGKSALGLSGMLTGTGMCFRRDILDHYGWTAYSVGEDWEYSVSLLLAGERIHFNESARVYAKESPGMKQASRQRLRWATGRYWVMMQGVWHLLITAVTQRRLGLIDAAATLVMPNYSTQAFLALVALGGSWFLMEDPLWGMLFPWSAAVIASLGVYFFLGVLLTESPLRTLAGLPLIPIFLPWRIAIEVLGLLGYGRGHWGRSSRASTSGQRVA